MWGALLKTLGGVVVADNKNTERERAEAHEINKVNATYLAKADAADALLPKLTYITADNKPANFQLNGKDVNWDLKDYGSNIGGAMFAADLSMQILNSPEYKALSAPERASIRSRIRPVQTIVLDQTTKELKDQTVTMKRPHDLQQIDLTIDSYNPEAIRVQKSDDTENNPDAIIQGTDGKLHGLHVSKSFGFDKGKIDNYVDSILAMNGWDTQNVNGDPVLKENARRLIIADLGPAALNTAMQINNLPKQITRKYLDRSTADFIVQESYKYFGGNTIEDETSRDAYFLNVIRAGKVDNVSKVLGQQGVMPGYDYGTADLEKYGKRYNLAGKQDLYASTSTAFENVVSMMDLIKDYEVNNPGKAVPLGKLGNWGGKLANLIDEGGGIAQLGEIVDLFKDAFGFKFGNVDGVDGRGKFMARIGKKITPKYIKEYGEFRASYEVYEEFLAYQLAAALQGGTGGRTISDQDVINIKNSLGNSLFQSGQFLTHRLEEIGKFLNTINEKNRLFAEAATPGDLDIAAVYRKYVLGTKISRTVSDGGYGYEIRDNDAAVNNYQPLDLSLHAVRLLQNIYKSADLKHSGNENQYFNGATSILNGRDPKTDELYDMTDPYRKTPDNLPNDGKGGGNKVMGFTLEEIKAMIESDHPDTRADGKEMLEDYNRGNFDQ